ncbi:ankyrin repeat-containing domain protein [Phialemonium atrogriseum]|uniref:Ankyrin repeat-containing domain protein n=1 Tax=Phialemonium atrogriseum TaxID=1093897 RepID=A0AAJ0FIR8_9PEZI|nr:ankyrin repeat-containing domain protein [Phialemonium atrogriseum]KAK1762360.1 ankyrin repeat-containing domain protein [Phialemonium atrogriseum]
MQLLHMAADFGSHDITKFLLDHMVESTDAQDIWGRTPLHFAAAGGVVSVVGLLTDASANIDIRCRPELRAWTPLHMAVAHNRRRVIPMLAGDGMDWAMWEDSLDMTPIEVAADYGLKDMVALLLIKHPDILDAEDGKGRRPLSNAAERAGAETVKFLLAHEAVDVNARDDAGRTALSYAAGGGKLSIARLLLAQGGIDANVADEERRTALMYAAEQGYKEIARLLLDHPGVDIDAEDDKGRSALDWARVSRRRGTMDLIRQKKAKQVGSTEVLESKIQGELRRGTEEAKTC